MIQRDLRLHLSAGEILPNSRSWLIEDGYLWLHTCNDDERTTTLGVWGPGELVIPTLFPSQQRQLCCLSHVQVEEMVATEEDHQAFVSGQVHQLVSLLEITRIRQAEERLFHCLLWLGERFGRINSQGVSLSFRDMNLTHRNLAEMTGMTRVTVTKALIRFRQEQRLCKQGDDELIRLKSLRSASITKPYVDG